MSDYLSQIYARAHPRVTKITYPTVRIDGLAHVESPLEQFVEVKSLPLLKPAPKRCLALVKP